MGYQFHSTSYHNLSSLARIKLVTSPPLIKWFIVGVPLFFMDVKLPLYNYAPFKLANVFFAT
jgi:hypothetical protein